MTGNDIFDELFVLELANNHLGDLQRGLKIINNFAQVVRFNNVRAAIKLQLRDIGGVAAFNRVPNVMTVAPGVPAKNVAEFIEYVKANPGKVNMASSGNGTSLHLSGELFMLMTGAKMTHVPYRGAAPAITDLMGNRVQVIFDNMPSIIQHIRSGALRALAVTSPTRAEGFSELPRVGDFVPGYEASQWYGIAAPKNTPVEIIDKLNTDINAVIAEPTMRERMIGLGIDPQAMTPAQFGKLIVDATEKWAEVIKFANIKME